MTSIIGSKVKVIIDRPKGSLHPNHPDMVYPVNYGYVEGVLAGDGEYQDAYVLLVDQVLDQFIGCVTAIIERIDDCENKWIVIPEELTISDEDILDSIAFQEQFFHIRLIR